MGLKSPSTTKAKAWVVFTDKTDVALLRGLKRGFRHCFIVLKQNDNWIHIDPQSGQTFVATYSSEYDIVKHYEEQGMTVVESNVQKMHKAVYVSISSCVDSVKRILGINKPFILTPSQLHNHLLKEQNNGK